MEEINLKQKEFWSGSGGDVWVNKQSEMDIMLNPLGTKAISKLDLSKATKIIDIGCGCGATTLEIAKQLEEGEIIGIDISEPMLARAAKNASDQSLSNANFQVLDVQVDDMPSDFDIAFSRFGVMFFENPIDAFKNIHNSIEDGGSLHFMCWTNVMENEFFTASANIIIKFLNKDFPAVTRAPGPFAFSEEEYIKQILIETDFRNIKVEKFYSEISTNDPPTKDGNLLFNIGLAGRLLSEENLSEEKLSIIKNEIIKMSQKRQKNGKISYKACLNYVSADKK